MNGGLCAAASPRQSCQAKHVHAREHQLDHYEMTEVCSITLGNYHGT